MRVLLVISLLMIGCGDDATSADLSAAHDMAVNVDQAGGRCNRVSDLIDQTCPMGQKCSYGGTLDSPMLECVAVNGSVAEKQPCTITNADAGSIGTDDCAKGLICLSQPEGTLCHKFCDKDADCTGAGAYCSPGGVCQISCTLLGTDCPAGYSCTRLDIAYDGQGHLGCRATGTTAVGAACTAPEECVANAGCSGTPKQCRTVCNDTHACSSGTCTAPPMQNTTVLGFCQ